jgi:Reverse transcriptase (RNA-dependent DNA polymerase)
MHLCDYFETFISVVCLSTICIVLSLSLSKGWFIRQLDVQNAFYMMIFKKPYICNKFQNLLILLSKVLYDLKQSPRAWFHTLSTALVSYGFVVSRYDPYLFIYHAANKIIILLVYVDDVVLTGSRSNLPSNLVCTLQKSFAVKDLGDLHYFFSVKVHKTNNLLHLSQSKYIKDLLTRATMSQAKPYPSPMIVNLSLFKF